MEDSQRVPCCKVLTAAGLSLNAQDRFGLTVLHYTGAGGRAPKTSTAWLLQNNADVNTKDQIGRVLSDCAQDVESRCRLPSSTGEIRTGCLLKPRLTQMFTRIQVECCRPENGTRGIGRSAW